MELRVVLVEDLQSMRSLLEDLLALVGGARIVGAITTEAEAKLWFDDNSGRWDLAVVDLALDQGSGMNVISRAKREPGVKVVVFSSYATPGVQAHCFRLGADAVFDKANTAGFTTWLVGQLQQGDTSTGD